MRKFLSHALIALGVTAASVVGISGTAHAASGGCRYDYASVGLGYSLEPCVGYSAALNYLSGVIKMRELPHSTDVYVCGQLTPASGAGPVGPGPHCSLMPRDENVEIDRDVDQSNDRCPASGTDYVYDSWIVDDGHRIGDVQSPRISC